MNHMKITIFLSLFFYLFACSVFCQTSNMPGDVALVGARIYPSPAAAPIENGTVLVRNGKITEVGNSDKIVVPKSVRIISCRGMVPDSRFLELSCPLYRAEMESRPTRLLRNGLMSR